MSGCGLPVIGVGGTPQAEASSETTESSTYATPTYTSPTYTTPSPTIPSPTTPPTSSSSLLGAPVGLCYRFTSGVGLFPTSCHPGAFRIISDRVVGGEIACPPEYTHVYTTDDSSDPHYPTACLVEIT